MQRLIRHIRERLNDQYSSGEIKALTRIIATELLGIKESVYFLKEPTELTPEQQVSVERALSLLQKQCPIQYILGYENFCDLRFDVNGNVLIPRPETQELVAWVASEATAGDRILDIGTGSGCIAIALARRLPECRVSAWDVSTDTLTVARRNAAANNSEINFEQRDILTYTPQKETFDTIVSNPPYIKESEKQGMAPNVLDWEPSVALFVPDSDPLLFYRTIAQKALTMLPSGGRLYFEINRAHGNDTVQMLAEAGYTRIELRKDFADNDRMIRAIKK